MNKKFKALETAIFSKRQKGRMQNIRKAWNNLIKERETSCLKRFYHYLFRKGV